MDLDWSSLPPPSQAAAPAKSARSPYPTSFDFLSTPTLTPNGTGPKPNGHVPPSILSSKSLIIPNGTRTNGLRPAASGTSTPVTSTPTIPSADAFSNLLSLSSASASGSSLPKTLSLAERQAQLAEERKKEADRERRQYEAHGAFWHTLGSTSKPQSTKIPSLHKPLFEDLLSPDIHGHQPVSAREAVRTPSTALPTRPRTAGTFWEKDFPPTQQRPPDPRDSKSSPPDPWDLDGLSASVDKAEKGTSGMRTPVSDFDFGEAGGDGSDEDILGEFSQTIRRTGKVSLRTLSGLMPRRSMGKVMSNTRASQSWGRTMIWEVRLEMAQRMIFWATTASRR